ncbi:TPA: hypothetical protein RTG46_001384 [Campylobacter jejuni]|nr:hypothetical protein [Campylobacter jejuni]HDZ5012829.1 hypothetical protein [Campylobacter jejuni]HDZ5016257.1 hypothetical protein [Campylobacter jejuni]HDZ5024382.1 hypothetical protein [Campylobacter jejuni]HDZ5032622.1 hypothetical protein [Campylobacter jejuni]
MFFPYIELNFFTFVLICFVFTFAWFKSQKIFKNESFLNDYQSCKKELNAFKEAVENFIKTNQNKNVLMSAFALKFAIKNNVFGDDYTRKFKQILKNYPNEKEFNIEINHYLS